MPVTIDLTEVHDLARDIRRHADEAPAKARAIMAAGAHRVDEAARAPVETGVLQASISADVDGLSFEVGPTVEYGLYQELGTSVMAAQPYLGPAFDQVAPTIYDALADMGAQVL